MINVQQTMVVGVGPIGRQFIEKLKSRISKYYGEDGLPAIKLMAVDVLRPQEDYTSGAASEEVETNLSPSEHVEIPMEDLAPSAERYHEMFPWLPDELITMDDDWRLTRAAVRLALHLNHRSLVDFLSHHFNNLGTVDASTAMADQGFQVMSERNEATLIMVGGLGDITGSALLLDMTYLMQYIYKRAGLQMASTSLLFMPPTVPTDTNAESIAYAALKEINAAMENQVYHTHFRGLQDKFENAPFNHGCYLLEMNTEKQTRLRNIQELLDLSAEWLFRVLLTPLKGYIDQFIADQGLINHIQNQPAVFAGLGMASFLLPVEELIEWCANQLGADILQGQILRTELFDKVADRLVTFYNQNQLKPDDLRAKRLGIGKSGREMEREEGIPEQIARLQHVPYDQVLPGFRNIIQTIRNRLPGLQVQVQQNGRHTLQVFRENLRNEINDIMRTFPAGGLSLATQFTDRMKIEFTRFGAALNRREVAVKAKNASQEKRLENYGKTLENAVNGIPGIGQTILSGLGILVFLGMVGVWLFPKPGDPPLHLIYFLGVVALVGAGLYYAINRTVSAVEMARGNYMDELRSRWRNEIDLMLIHEARTLYPDLTQETGTLNNELRAFSEDMHDLARIMVGNLDIDHMVGDLGFPLQKSVLNGDIIDSIYSNHLGIGGTGAQMTMLIEDMGTPDGWRKKTPQVIGEKILAYGRQRFEALNELTAEEVFWEQFAEINKAENRVRIIRDLSYPLWLYDTWQLGQDTPPMADTYVACYEPDTSKLVPRFRGIVPEIKVQSITERHGVFVITVRRGLPLFALNRMEQFRNHYTEWVVEGLPPIHLDDEAALVRDISDTTERVEVYLAAMAFAVGEAFDLIRKDGEGVFVARVERTTKRLTKSPVSSQILLGLDIKFLEALSKAITTHVEEAGATAVIKQLDDYLESPTTQIPDWQRNKVDEFIAAYLRG